MILYKRLIQENIEKRLFLGKIVIIYGARQIGKTTLVKQILSKYPEKSIYLNCEMLSVQQALSIPEAEKLKSYLGDNKLVVLDEAQKIPNVGLILKILVDTYPEMQIIATGSSSFDLANKISEPLTGRADRFILYPFSLAEISGQIGKIEVEAKLENLLRFGAYPEVFFLGEKDSISRLDEISANYLYKDVLEFEGIKKSGVIVKLLQLLALQVGQEVSLDELATNLGISRLTVQKYIDLLEQSFVIFTLRAFSRNLRNEISKSFKVYFYDLGIRNSLIQNFNNLDLRNDLGGLWENLLIIEKIKHDALAGNFANRYFWRTYDQKEIDYIEESNGELRAYEFKWRNENVRAPEQFLNNYAGSKFLLVNKNNYWNFLAD